MYAHCLGGPPFSFTVHGPEEFESPMGLAEKVGEATFVAAISSYGRSQLYLRCKATEWPKVQVVRCGIESSFHRVSPLAAPRSHRLVCVGRLCEAKGQLLLVEATARLRAKGVERSILITDAAMPAMCTPGPYRLGDVEVELLEDQRVVLRGGSRLAGSSLRIDRAIENVMRIARLSLTEAVAMATVNPARVGRVSSRQRGLTPGERGDVVRFRVTDGRVEVLETYLSGRQVFAAAMTA